MQEQRLLAALALTCQEVRFAPLGAMCQSIGQDGTDVFYFHLRTPAPPGQRLRVAIDRGRQTVRGTIAHFVAQVASVVAALITDLTGAFLPILAAERQFRQHHPQQGIGL